MGYGTFFSHIKQEARRRGGEEKIIEMIRVAKGLGVDQMTVNAEKLPEEMPFITEAGAGVNIVYCVSRLIHGEELDKTLRAAEDTAKAGGKILMLVPGFYENGLTDKEALQNAVPLIREVVRAGKSLGIHVTIEDYGGKFTPYSTISQIVNFLNAVEDLEFVYDSGNLLYHRQDALDLWDATADRIVGIHGKDLSDTPVPETPATMTPAGDLLYPTWFGGGMLPAKELCRRIREKNIPPELISFEHDGGGTPDTLEFLRKSVETIRG